MAEYIYHCPACKIDYSVTEPMIVSEGRRCEICGALMGRKPQAPAVNWGGLRPSQGSLHPNIKQMIDDASRRRGEGT